MRCAFSKSLYFIGDSSGLTQFERICGYLQLYQYFQATTYDRTTQHLYYEITTGEINTDNILLINISYNIQMLLALGKYSNNKLG